MAEHISDEHGGSSVAKVTATNALRNKLNNIWQYLKLKSNDFAFKYKSRSMRKEAELFLLMCSIFPTDFKIPIELLVTYGMGLELFEDVHDMSAARCRVLDIISIINGKKYSRKAIGGKIRLAHEPMNHYVEMLDGGHDLGKSIASSYPLVFHRETVIEKWPETNSYQDCYGLLLVLKKVNEHLINLECPKLTLLQLQYREDSRSIPIDFFEGMKELLVLSLDLPSLPQSLNVMRNLRTLRLKVPKCEDMSWVGCLVHLEFLSISISSLTEIPKEMAQLEKLRLLDLRKMNIAYIPPGVFSRLLKIEELYLPLNFRRWGCKAKNYDNFDEWELDEQDNYDVEGRINANISEIADGEKINTSLTEIVSLSLNALHICVPNSSILPKKSPIFKNIREFNILMPNNDLYQPFGKVSTNVLQLTGEASDIKESVCDLLSRAEDLSLRKVRNLKNVIYQLEDYGFPQLKKMIISECDELENIVGATKKQSLFTGDPLFRQLECLHLSMLSNLKKICHERLTNLRCFSNLSQISIRFCPKLKYVFPLSIVKGLTLKSMEILDCNEMEGIFYEDQVDSSPLTFGSIEALDLHSLPSLVCLLVHKGNMIDGVHDEINESLTINKSDTNFTKGFPTNESIDDKEIIRSPPTSTSRAKAQKDVTGKQVLVVKNTDLSNHMKMYSAFPSRLVVNWLRNLKSLKIAFCDLLKVVFLSEENHATSRAFNSLEVLELHGLRNLVHIWFQISPKITAFKNLQLIVLLECGSSYLFSYGVAKTLVQLQKVYISRCEKMEEIIVKDDENERKDKIVLPRLRLLELQHMPNLRILFGGNCEIELPLLESLKLKQCNEMKAFSYGSLKMPMLEGIEVNGSFHLLTKDHNVIFSGVITPHDFTLADLKIATKNFSSDNLLGKGDFGRVYKGWIDRKTFKPSKTSIGMPVAVKRLKSAHEQKLFSVWKSKVDIRGIKSHPNLVKLLGHCWEDGKFLLVYEFIPRGSLHDQLFTSKKRNPGIEPLSWDMRIKIATGAARGLNFLHTLEKPIIHRNIKSANILLDNDYNSKIAEFGWTHLDWYSQEARWNVPGGTSIYMDPAFFLSGHLHVESDAYSFGVVLLELMTGLKAIDAQRSEEQTNLVRWLKPILSQERELKVIMDSTMEGQYSSKAMLLIAKLASKCTEYDLQKRPTMGEVLKELQQIDAIKEKYKH